MLGSGRPFVLELHRARHGAVTAAELASLTASINTKGTGRVGVHDLQLVPRTAVAALREQEEAKEKTYTYASTRRWGWGEGRQG
jgi:tRNA U54 and U55 pseudouridine synthase Pus10